MVEGAVESRSSVHATGTMRPCLCGIAYFTAGGDYRFTHG